MPKKENCFITIYIYLICLILLHLAPFLNPNLRVWGFNHLIFLPDSFTIAYIAVGLLALILPFLAFANRWGDACINEFSRIFFESRYKYLNRGIFVVFLGALFYLLSATVYFLGDGYNIVAGFSSSSAPIYKWSEKGIIHLFSIIQSFFGERSEYSATMAFRVVSVLSGCIVIWFYFLTAEIASSDRLKRLFLFIVILFSGTLLLFFGYIEYYPLLWVFMTGFIYFGLWSVSGGRNICQAFLFLLAGSLLHLQMLFFVPAFVVVLLSTGWGKLIYSKFNKLVWTVLIAGAAALCYNLVHKYLTDLAFQDIFLPLFQGKPIDPAYAIISIPHLLDIFNEFILISPLLFLLVILAWSNLRTIITTRIYLFLVVTAIGSMLPLFVVDPKLTMPRDWDLFSMSAYSAGIVLILLLPEKYYQIMKRFVLSISLLLLISVIPFLSVHLKTQPSEKFLANIINLDFKRSHPSLRLLYEYYIDKGDSLKADSLGRIYNSGFPNMNKIGQAFNVIGIGDMAQASAIIRTIKPDKFDADYHSLMGIYYYRMADYNRAVKYYDSAIQLRPYNGLYYYERAKTYAALRKLDFTQTDLQSAYDLDPNRMTILNGLADLYSLINRPDSCIYYAGKMVERDSTVSVSYYYIAKAYVQKKDITMAEQYARRYSEFVKDDSTLTENLRELARLIKRVKD
jgi:tetratricopeptide (TPR) repeat protein